MNFNSFLKIKIYIFKNEFRVIINDNLQIYLVLNFLSNNVYFKKIYVIFKEFLNNCKF